MMARSPKWRHSGFYARSTTRRTSSSFVPVAKPKKATPQLALQIRAGVRQQSNEIANEIRFAVGRWRAQGFPHITSLRDLLVHRRAEDRMTR